LAKLAEAAKDAVLKLIDLGKQSIFVAGRVDELRIIAQLLGQRAGFTAEEIDAQTKAIRGLGIEANVALSLQAQFVRYQLNMAQATDLARVAQDAAALSDENSSQALDGLLNGILTYNQRILRTHGINIDVSKSMDIYAASLGKTAEQLTEAEKVQATLNAVIAAGASINGVYEATMQSAYKQMGSLKRLFDDLKLTIGGPFQKAFGDIVKVFSDLSKAFNTAFSEGGRLYPVLIALGAVASLVTGAIRSLVSQFTSWLAPMKEESPFAVMARQASGNAEVFKQASEEMVDNFKIPFLDAALDAIEWGANIAINLAMGLIQGAAAAITAALNWISNLLTSWLAPGSPPKIIPDLDKYGQATMEEYLNAFTKADFSALDAIQGQMRQVFSTLVDQGQMTKAELGPLFASISKDIIEAMATGTVDEGLFDRIREAGGKFGEELADLARKQIALAQAEEDVKNAETALADARARQAQSGKEVNKLTMEYNRMLRSGASAEELKRQKAKIDAAAAAHDAATAEAEQAEQNLDTAQANIDTLKEQAQLQAEILEQLLELAQAQIPPQEAPAPGGGEAPEVPGTPELPGGGEMPDLSTLEDKIRDAVDRIRQNIIDKLKDVWQDLVDIWNEKMGPALDKLKAAWEGFKRAVAPITDFLKAKWEAFKNWLSTIIPSLLTGLKNWWAQHGANVVLILQTLWNTLVQIATVFWEALVGMWNRYGDNIIQIATDVWNFIVGIVENGMEGIGEIIDLIANIIKGDWEAAWENIKNIAALIWDNIKNLFIVVLDVLKLLWEIALDYLEWYWTTVWEGISGFAIDIWNKIKKAAEQIWGAFVKGLETLITDLANFLKGIWTAVKDVAEETWKIISGLANTLWSGISNIITAAVTGAKTLLDDLWGLIKGAAELAWTQIKATASTVWQDIKGFITSPIDAAKTWLETAWASIKSKADEIWGNIKDSVSGIAQALSDEVERIIGAIPDKVKSFVSNMVQVGKDLIQGIINGVGQMANALWNYVEGLIKEALKRIADAIIPGSPSKVTTEWGKSIPQGLAKGIKLTADLPKLALTDALDRMMPTNNIPVVNGPSYRTMNLNVNNNLSNQMDVMALESLITRTVIKAMRR
jgi:phage-related protein